jgi:hypothetical protein
MAYKMKTLQDIVLENDSIEIISSGSEIVLVNEGIGSMIKGMKDKIFGNKKINGSTEKESENINRHIKNFIKTLSKQEQLQVKRNFDIKSFTEDDDSDDSNSTIISAPHEFLVKLQKYLKSADYSSTVVPSYDYDIDDIAEIHSNPEQRAKFKEVPEDTQGEISKMFILHRRKNAQDTILYDENEYSKDVEDSKNSVENNRVNKEIKFSQDDTVELNKEESEEDFNSLLNKNITV